MLKIKLSRTGKKNQPSYRVVVQEARSKRDGRVIEILGHYLPLQSPAVIKIKRDRYAQWIGKGAQPTDTVRKLYKRA